MSNLTARDELPARDSGSWGETKLAFLDRYCPAALLATERKVHRYFVDLFAGPGVNVLRASGGKEYEGSPLRILSQVAEQRADLHFTHAVFINSMRRNHRALSERVDRMVAGGRSRIPRENIELIHDDANHAITRVMQGIPRRAYVLVFADMEAPKQWPWESMRALKAYGHDSVDLYTLFPLDMAIMRLLSYGAEHANRYAHSLDRFFGTDAWRGFVQRRITTAHGPQLRRDLVRLYLDQLRTLWSHAGEMIDVYYRGDQRLYKMLFASDHPAARVISDWIKTHTTSAQQGELFD